MARKKKVVVAEEEVSAPAEDAEAPVVEEE
jgi:hypothetical protein